MCGEWSSLFYQPDLQFIYFNKGVVKFCLSLVTHMARVACFGHNAKQSDPHSSLHENMFLLITVFNVEFAKNWIFLQQRFSYKKAKRSQQQHVIEPVDQYVQRLRDFSYPIHFLSRGIHASC